MTTSEARRGNPLPQRAKRALATTAIVACTALAAACGPATVGPQPRTSQLDGVAQSEALLDRTIAQDGPGCAGAVSIEGVLAWSGEAGLADLDTSLPITASTRFDIASVSKQFTALAVLRLVDAGALALDDSVALHLDGMPSWADDVTITQLLHHTSGIADYTSLLVDAGLTLEHTTQHADALAAISSTRLEFAPGARFSYSNSNYVLLASIVEAVTGNDFASVLDEWVLDGEQMRLEPASTAADVARSYRGGVEARSTWLQVGDGSIVATAAELALWGSVYARTADPAVRNMTSNAVDDGAGAHYGAGIGIEPTGALGHSGAWAGFVSLFWVSPDRSTVIALTCNSPDLDVDKLARGLLTIWG